MPDTSPAARERAVRTLIAATTFGDASKDILGAVAELESEGDQTVVVAVVDREFTLSGVHYVEREQLVERVPALEGDDGWAMVFSNGTSGSDIARRCEEMAVLAEKRIAALDRIAARRGE